MNNEDRKSARKISLNGSKVRFGKELGEYSECEEDAKIEVNKRKYKKPGN
jgi:hypothetical protein